MNYAAVKGTKDILPPESRQWQNVEARFREVAELFSYGEIRIPTFEYTEVFQRGVGDGTDIVQKEMYTFLDKGGRSITLRPEGTAGVVRSFIQKGMSSLPYPMKLYYLLNLFRYENVQEGRYREFHQLGLEAFGAAGPEIDAEVIALLQMFFDCLGLQETHLKINSIGCPDCRAQYENALRAYFQPQLAALCDDCKRRYEKNPLRILDCKVEACKKISEAAPLLLDYLDDACSSHFVALQAELDALGIVYHVEPRLVRGLDYYTKTVFEYVSEHVGTQGTICGGGRYDRLVEGLGGPAVPACGFALGVERLMKELAAQGVLPQSVERRGIFIASMGDEAALAARKLALDLRRLGVLAETELCGRSLKGQMKYAGKSALSHSVVLGDQELADGQVQIRNMQDGTQQRLPLTDLSLWLKLVGRND